MATFYIEIVAPDRNVFRGNVQTFRAPGIGGSFSVMANHAPMLAALEPGPLFVTTEAGERIAYATSGGFVEVLHNEVIALVESAEPASDIDVERARAAEAKALEQLQSGDDLERQKAAEALARARNRLRVGIGKV